MSQTHLLPAILSVSLGLAVSTGVAAHAQSRPASNITPSDARSVIAPALPIPPVPSVDPPSAFLASARSAVESGRTGEAQEALERAETRLLDRATPTAIAGMPDNQQAVLATGAARRALAVQDRSAAIAAIDDALNASSRPPLAVFAPAQPLSRLVVPTPAPVYVAADPVIMQALLPGHWELRGARYEWVPPETILRPVETASLVTGHYVWRDGAYVWVPQHVAR